jgi:glycosyltransferase involved in cell wall biosynthesis
VRIDHINAYLTGGAAVAARRLHHALLADGIESRFWFAGNRGGRPVSAPDASYRQLVWSMPPVWDVGHFGPTAIRWGWERTLRSYFRRGGAARPGMYNGPVRPYPTPFVPGGSLPDLLHLHWVSRIIDYRSFFGSLPTDLPLVWTLHDMQPLTGGCHHAHDCNRFEQTCGNCPVLGRPGRHDLSARDHGIKKAALAGRVIHIVTPSRWLERLARASGLLPAGCTFQTIHNGIKLTDFQPLEKQAARRQLGLPEDRLLIGYAAESLSNKPKGIEEFLRAISQLPSEYRVTGLLFGKDEPPAGIATVPLINLGFLTSPAQIRLAYAAADIFTVPSHAETISQTAPEALACGTPVVASNVGGIPEIIRHGETGLLAIPQDSESLAGQLAVLADDAGLRQRLATAGRDLVHREFEASGQTAYYRKLYTAAIGTAAGGPR